MNKFLLYTNHFFEQLPDNARRYRLWIWLSFFAISAVVLSGMPKIHVDMTMEAYFKKDDPAKLAYDEFRAEFGSDEVLLLTYQARDGDVFSDQSLKALHALHKELDNHYLNRTEGSESGLDHITDITSLINVSFMEARDGVLLSKPFIGDKLPTSNQHREQLRTKALNHPDYNGVYVSKDSRFGAIVIKTGLGAQPVETNTDAAELEDGEAMMDMDSWDENAQGQDQATPKFRQADVEQYSLFMKSLREVIEKPQYAEHLQFHPVGIPAITAFLNDILLKEMGMVFVGSLLLIFVVLWGLFRSFSAVVWPLCIAFISFFLTLGLAGWSGATMTIMINIIMLLIVAVGVSNSVHILSGYLFFREKGEPHQLAIKSVFKKSGLACFLTSLTTIIGLSSLTLTPIVPIQNFGFYAATGVFFTFLLAMFILPLMLDLWAPVSKKKQFDNDHKPHVLQRLLRHVEHIGYNHAKPIVAVFAILTVALLMGIPKIKVDSNIIEILPHDSSVRQNVGVVDANMSGSAVMDILFDAGTANAFKDPRMLNKMEALQQYIHSNHGELAGKTVSLVNVTKDAYKSLHDDDTSYYRIPQERQMLAQTLFMFDNANPDDRRQLVSDDYSNARMTITLKAAGSYVYVPMIDDIYQQIDSLFKDVKADYPELNIQVTGGMSLMTRIVDYISWSQLQSFAVALGVISLLLLVVFGSKRVGLIAIVPNLMPIIFTFGLMGYLGIPLDTDTLLVAPIIIGIAVDDTIHYLSHYRAGILKTGDIRIAIQKTTREAGQALMFTSIVLALGFLIFMFSAQLSLRNFGILASFAIMVALITDLLLLPALCKLFKAKFNYESETSDNRNSPRPVESFQ